MALSPVCSGGQDQRHEAFWGLSHSAVERPVASQVGACVSNVLRVWDLAEVQGGRLIHRMELNSEDPDGRKEAKAGKGWGLVLGIELQLGKA